MADLENLLAKGLAENYAGRAENEKVQRGPFTMNVGKYSPPEGGSYRDEWIALRAGGGQELARIDQRTLTRLYAGGTIEVAELKSLGLIKDDVTDRLKIFINGSEGKTRLREDYHIKDGDWEYDYDVTHVLADIPLTMALETIKFKKQLVFAHGFLLSPVE